MTNVRKPIQNKERWILLALFTCIALFTTIDIIADLQDNLPTEHYIHELGLLALALSAALYQMRLIWSRDQQIAVYTSKVAELEHERLQFRERFSKVKNEFSSVVDQQFEAWNLTPVEKDIALLLIKGLSMKEVAQTRQTSEGTVRQQAAAIYKKSGLSGRQELAAIFLDELFSI